MTRSKPDYVEMPVVVIWSLPPPPSPSPPLSPLTLINDENSCSVETRAAIDSEKNVHCCTRDEPYRREKGERRQ